MKIPETNHYLEFVKKHFQGGEYIVNWHHNVASYYLWQWVNGNIRWLIMEWPPQYGKSEEGAVMLPPYIFSRFPTAKVAYTTYGSELVKRMSRGSKNVMRSDAFREEFSELTVPLGFRGVEYWENSLGGIYTGVGRKGALAGTPQDFLITDDLFKDYDEAMSPVIRDSAWFWFITVALKRLSPLGRALLFFTRWNDDDVIGRCLKLMRTNNKYARPWVRITFPGLMTEELFKTKHFADPRKPGEPLWPWKENRKELEMARIEMGDAAFNAVYQQTPVNAEGTKIKSKWLTKIRPADIPSGLKWHRFYRFGELEKNTIDKKNATCLLAKIPNGKYIISDMDYFDDDWPSCLERLKNVGKDEKKIKIGFKKVDGSRLGLFKQIKECGREVKTLKAFPAVNSLIWTPEAKSGKMLLVEDENTAGFLKACREYTGGKDKRTAEIDALAGAYNMIASKRSIVQVYADRNRKKAS